MALRILAVADLHLIRPLRAPHRVFRREDEYQRLIEQVVDAARQYDVDVVLIAGDCFHDKRAGIDAERLFVSLLTQLVMDKRRVIVISGNHDSERRLQLLGFVFSFFPLRPHIVTPETIRRFVAGEDVGGKWYVEPSPIIELGEFGFCCLPFIDVGYGRKVYDKLVERSKAPVADSELQKTAAGYRVYFQALVRRMLALLNKSIRAPVLVTHCFFEGAVLSSRDSWQQTETPVYTAGAYAIPLAVFNDLPLALVVAGHVHRRQQLNASVPCWYCGSPLPLDFGEEGYSHGALFIELSPPRPPAVEQIDFSYRQLKTIAVQLDEQRSVDELLNEVRSKGVGNVWLRVKLQVRGNIPRRQLAELTELLYTQFDNVARVVVPAFESDVPVGRRLTDTTDGPADDSTMLPDFTDVRAMFKLYWERIKNEPPPSELQKLLEEMIQNIGAGVSGERIELK